VIDRSKLTAQWLAGFFDGEGCVSCYLQQRVMKLDVFVAQSNFPLIAAIADMFEQRPRVHCRSKRTCYSIHFTGRGCLKFLEFIKDHVIVKREQVLIAIEFANLIGNSGPPKDSNAQIDRRRLGQQIRDLNHVDHDLVDDSKGGYVS
jgi:hypothetical protein